jgi:MraZ protein
VVFHEQIFDLTDGLLLGTFDLSLDPKGRLIIPKRYRAVFEAGLYVTYGDEENLVIYALPEFNKLREVIQKLDVTDFENTRRQDRFFSGYVTSLDKLGRFLLTPHMRGSVGLVEGGEVTLTGSGNRMKIWAPQRWDEYVRGSRG